MSGALAGRQTDKELEKGRVEKTTVKRYWPGRAPAWIEQQQQEQAAAVPSEDALAQQVQRTAISAPVVVKKVADPRLARLAQRSTDRDEAVEEHRQIRAAEVVRRRHRPSEEDEQSAEGSEDDSESSSEAEEEAQQEQEEDEEELQKRRDALKER
jgi:microfibrillar-associated protein 1